jgi:hypothetical protein
LARRYFLFGALSLAADRQDVMEITDSGRGWTYTVGRG